MTVVTASGYLPYQGGRRAKRLDGLLAFEPTVTGWSVTNCASSCAESQVATTLVGEQFNALDKCTW
jgi:hypothetical protein